MDPILPGRLSVCPAIASVNSEKTTPMFQGDHVQDAVVVLSDPRLKGSDLVYHVDILEGKIPATAGLSTLFIDSAVRRVARRTSRRTARRVDRRHD